jgi:D-alanyl-D-alanine carboxypeptidase
MKVKKLRLKVYYMSFSPIGNDAAYALADHFPGGREAFMQAINQKINSLNLTDTYFTNPAGIDEYNHYSTAHDLAIIGAELVSNPTLAEIVATPKITISNTDGDFVHELETTDELLGKIKGLRGIKTGWTEFAGECFVSYVERDNHGIITVLLGSYDRFGETQKLIDWVFTNHEWQEVKIPKEILY